MPHNLYLHSSIVQTRVMGDSVKAKRAAINLATLDVAGSLTLAIEDTMPDIQPRHLSSEFEEELDELRRKLLRMASQVESLIADALAALAQRDTARAESVVARDAEVDHLEKEIDDHCLKILALRQPAAGDLRQITSALKVVTDLERMGDLCVNIARAAIELNRIPRAAAVDL
jgi:phosphate uptake regulator